MSHVFISYSKKNKAYARKLADHLLANGFDVWIDDRIDFGSNWEREIFKAIDGCSAIIVIMTPEAYESIWVQRERLYAEASKKPPFPLLLEGNVFPFYAPIQYYDVHGEKLPANAFFEQLEKFSTRSGASGQDVAVIPQQLAARHVKQPIDLRLAIPLFLLAVVAILIAFPLLSLLTNLSNRSNGTITPTARITETIENTVNQVVDLPSNTPTLPNTAISTFTSTSSFTDTWTSTPLPTAIPTGTDTYAARPTVTFTATSIPPTATFTLTRTFAPTVARTPTPFPTYILTNTNTPTNMPVSRHTYTAIPPTETQTVTSDIALPNITVRVESANFRNGPGTNYNVVGTARLGEKFSVIAQAYNHSWYLISRPDDQLAWIASSVVDIPENNLPIVEVATIPPTVVIQLSTQDTQATNATSFCGMSIGNTAFIEKGGTVGQEIRSLPRGVGNVIDYVSQGEAVIIVGGPDIYNSFIDADCGQGQPRVVGKGAYFQVQTARGTIGWLYYSVLIP